MNISIKAALNHPTEGIVTKIYNVDCSDKCNLNDSDIYDILNLQLGAECLFFEILFFDWTISICQNEEDINVLQN